MARRRWMLFMAPMSLLGACLGCSRALERAAYIAAVPPDQAAAFADRARHLPGKLREALCEHGAVSQSMYLKELRPGEPYVFWYLEYRPAAPGATAKVLTQDPRVQAWSQELAAQNLLRQDEQTAACWQPAEQVFFHEGQTEAQRPDGRAERYGMVIGLRPELVESYKLLHQYAWPPVLSKITEGNIRNYSIFLYKQAGAYYLFSYFEYVGSDFAADMAAIDNDPATVAWMKFTDATCQLPLPTRRQGEWWALMEEVMHADPSARPQKPSQYD